MSKAQPPGLARKIPPGMNPKDTAPCREFWWRIGVARVSRKRELGAETALFEDTNGHFRRDVYHGYT